METRRHASRAEWQKRIERWRDSGPSAEQFAVELGINLDAAVAFSSRPAGMS